MARSQEIGSWVMLNALWVPLTIQDTALMTIAAPSMILRLAPETHVATWAMVAAIAALSAMIVPPIAGWLSDRNRRSGGTRRAFVLAGVAIDVAALVALAYANSIATFAIFLVIATAGANVALAAYQALLPESVPRKHWGVVSGIRGAATLVGTVLGFAVAGQAPSPHVTFLVAAVVMALGALTLFGIHEGKWQEPDRAHVRDWHDFMVVFAARALVFFGLILLQTFVYDFFNDVQKIGDSSAGTALYAFATMGGAIVSTVGLGILSDRVPKKIVTSLTCIPMAIAVIGFAVSTNMTYILPFAVLFGIGFGGVISSGWALAMDSIPELRDVARDLGLWGIATNLPNVVAPLIGGWLIELFHGTRSGYQAVFALAGLSFTLASISVLRVGRKPLSSMYAWPLRFATITSNGAWDHLAYRVRGWGGLPWKRGATLVVANHQHDLESMTLVCRMTIAGSWRHPLFTASARRMYEPGFLAIRLPWARSLLRRVNAGPLFVALGMLPLENELSSREVSALAWSVQQRHGVLALSEFLDERVAGKFPPGTTTVDLWNAQNFDAARSIVKIALMRDPYRRETMDETRTLLDADLARMENVLRRGGSFYLTPEGRYSVDGRIGPMRGAIDKLAPLATIYLAGVSYDPFAPGRLSMLYRMVRLDDREHLTPTLAATRPVTASQLLGAWLDGRTESFSADDACAAVEERLRSLPATLFVDPELGRNPQRMVRRALPEMVRRGILEAAGQRYTLGATRVHPQFPQVTDIVAYQARMFEETLANASYAVPFRS
jgi:MFS family permease